MLNINAGALKYNENIFYEFTISTQYFNQTYSQLITINIDPSTVVYIFIIYLLKPLENKHRNCTK